MKKTILLLFSLVLAMNVLAQDEEEEFIFDPQGIEKIYCMSLYSYDSNNARFVSASSLKSQVRYDADGKTVYFKDLTKSLGVDTWLKGTIDGDTIRIPYGQHLAYYKSKYLIFFCPMIYDDNLSSDNVIAQDEMKLVIKGDSIVSPYFGEGRFQGAAGYVVISDSKQGFLSYDIEHNMRLLEKPLVEAPEDVDPVAYVYTVQNSAGETYKSKVNVKKNGNDLYMQLSTSATSAYVHGVIDGDSISVESGQPITDGKFIYYYSLADPVYDAEKTDSIVDFLPALSGKRLAWHEDTQEITSSPEVFGVDYMDGMEYCMEYVTNPRLSVYGGDKPAKPMAPKWAYINFDSYPSYVSFYLYALDTDSNYINRDSITYRLLYDDDPYTFDTGTYWNINEDMDEVPYSFAEGYDFWVYNQLHYVYTYEQLFTTIGVQSIYTVDDVKTYSDIALYNNQTQEASVQEVVNDGIKNLASNKFKGEDVIYNLNGLQMKNVPRGIFIRNGKKYLK